MDREIFLKKYHIKGEMKGVRYFNLTLKIGYATLSNGIKCAGWKIQQNLGFWKSRTA